MIFRDRHHDVEGTSAARGHSGGLAVIIAASLLVLSGPVLAQHEGKSADQVGKELSNPASSLASLFLQFTHTGYDGDLPNAGDQDNWQFSFQPVLPFPVGDKGRNIIFRPLVTVPFDQPSFNATTGDFEDASTGLGDITYELVYASTDMKTATNGVLWGIGIAGTMDTASNDDIGNDQWRVGPALLGGIIRKWGLIGLVLEHQWDVGGSNDTKSSITSGQYFYAFGLGDGWQIEGGPTFAYNWEASSGDRWTFPVGVGVGKTTRWGNMPIKFSAQVQYAAATPDTFGPDWILKFQVTPVVPNPFVRN